MKVRIVVYALGLAFACVTSAGTARSDSMDCNGRIVATGDSLSQVRGLCSDPDTASQHVEVRTYRGPDRCCRHEGKTHCRRGEEYTVSVVVDQWMYDFGKNRFTRHLRFENGRLVSIETGSYGQKPPQ